MKKVSWAIVGPGNIANKFAKAIANVDSAELVAVCSRTEEKGRAFAQKYNIPEVFCSEEKMAESDTVDAVYIANPHPFHKPSAEVFLKAKKHVLCEKPICTNAKDARKLEKIAKDNGVFLMEAMWTRFLPAIIESMEVAKSGKIGKVMGVKADFCYNLAPEVEPKIYRNDMAGGSLLDVGVYCLNIASFFLGDKPESITAVANVDYGVDCHTNVILKYKDGELATLSSAINLEKPAEGYVYGEKGHIYFPRFYCANEFSVIVGDETERIVKPSIGDGFEEEIIEATNCILNGKCESDIHPMSKSITILEQMDEIRRQIGLSYPFDEE